MTEKVEVLGCKVKDRNATKEEQSEFLKECMRLLNRKK